MTVGPLGPKGKLQKASKSLDKAAGKLKRSASAQPRRTDENDGFDSAARLLKSTARALDGSGEQQEHGQTGELLHGSMSNEVMPSRTALSITGQFSDDLSAIR